MWTSHMKIKNKNLRASICVGTNYDAAGTYPQPYSMWSGKLSFGALSQRAFHWLWKEAQHALSCVRVCFASFANAPLWHTTRS